MVNAWGFKICPQYLNYAVIISIHMYHFVTYQVADCGTREFTDQKREEMSVSELVDRWINDSSQKGGNTSTRIAKDERFLYLKDWHFVKVNVGLFIYLLFFQGQNNL